MKLKITSFLTALILVISVNAQDKKTLFQIKKGRKVYSVTTTKKGLLIKTGKDLAYNYVEKDNGITFRHYDFNLNLVLEKTIKETLKTDWNYPNATFLNYSGDKIYHIENTRQPKGNIIHQLSLNGIVKKHQTNKDVWKPLAKSHLKAVFANNNDICYLFTKYGISNHKKKKVNEKLILFKINSTNFSSSLITLDMPKITTNPERTSFFTYENHNNEGVYFASINTINKGESQGFKVNVTVVKQDYNNNTLKKVKISFDRNNVHNLTRVNNYYKNNENTHLHYNDISHPRNRCSIKIDEKNDYIYLFGIEQLKKSRRENHIRTIFIKKYDFNGELIWEHETEGITAHGISFNTQLTIKKNQSIRLIVSNLYWEFSSEGEPITFRNYDNTARGIYWKANRGGGKYFQHFDLNEKSDALIEHIKKMET